MLRPKEVVQLWVDAFNNHVYSRIFNSGYDSYRRKYF